MVTNEDDSNYSVNLNKNQEIKELKRNLNDSCFSNYRESKIPFLPSSSKKFTNMLFSNEKNYFNEGNQDVHANRRCMTELKNYNMSNRNFHTSNFGLDMEIDNMYCNEYDIVKENEDLRKNLVEIKRNFVESVQNKDQHIKRLNNDLLATIENCEKMIIEAEENYKKYKKQVSLSHFLMLT